jgi:hypothetical protein
LIILHIRTGFVYQTDVFIAHLGQRYELIVNGVASAVDHMKSKKSNFGTAMTC